MKYLRRYDQIRFAAGEIKAMRNPVVARRPVSSTQPYIIRHLDVVGRSTGVRRAARGGTMDMIL